MSTPEASPPVRLTALARVAFYVGATAYGGPAVMAHARAVFVRQLGWVTEADFLAGLSLAQMLPGATAGNLMQYLGYRLRGARGAAVVSLAFLAPCFLLMLALSALYSACGTLPIVHTLLLGLGAAVVGLIVNSMVALGRLVLTDAWSMAVAVMACGVSLWLHPHVLLIAGGAALVGWGVWKSHEENGDRHHFRAARTRRVGSQEKQSRRTMVAKMVPVPIFLVLAVVALFLFRATPAVSLALAFLRVGTFAFGGGFAALPVIEHETLAVHHWLTPHQFLDGIALGQITPGPVLITATFVGYRVLGPLGALLATVAVFLPAWCAMLLLAYQHGRVAHLPELQAAVRGMVAGFIGVLAAIAFSLAQQSVTDWRTWAIASAAVVVLILWKRDPLWVILGAAGVSPLLFRGM
jgi:chromate transporter